MRCAVLEVTLARELFPEQNTRLGIVGIIMMMMIKRMMMIIIINSDFHPHYIGKIMKIFDEKPEEESEKESNDERGDSSGHRDHHHLGD